jgi:thiol-disulfide isomerase/thioredoxin
MLLTLLTLRFALSVIFGLAGAAKLLDLRGAREAVTNFGVPPSLAKAVARILPLTEIGIAFGLLFGKSAWQSALAASVLLMIFVVAIGINLLRGRAPECHCFGQLYSRPLGWPTLARNLVFAVCALFVFWQVQPVANTALVPGGTSAGQSASLFVAVAAVTTLLLLWNRRKRNVINDRDGGSRGLALHSPAPAFDLASYEGKRGSLDQLLHYGKPLLLIFTNPNCGPCVTLFEEVREWQRDHREQITIALITQGTIKENFVNVTRNSLANVLLQQHHEVAEAYRSTMTPTAVVISLDRKIASEVAAGAEEIRNLLRQTLALHAGKIEIASHVNEPVLSA